MCVCGECAKVPAAIAECQRAGITVRLVTGDALSTAKFVAFKCGILRADRVCSDDGDDADADDLALDGRQFNKLTRSEPGQPVRTTVPFRQAAPLGIAVRGRLASWSHQGPG